jgi:predicted RNA binding protein YcfA (HicA-like mRNA interferase family)
MAIDYRGLRSLTARVLIAALTRDGFYFVRQTGSNQRYRHPDGRRVTVAPHGTGSTFARKTLESIIRSSGALDGRRPQALEADPLKQRLSGFATIHSGRVTLAVCPV